MGITEEQWRALNAYVDNSGVESAAQKLRVNISTLSRNLRRSHFRQLAETAKTMAMFFREEWG
jgi:transposase-like protein